MSWTRSSGTRNYALAQIIKAADGDGIVAFAKKMHGAELEQAFSDASGQGIGVVELESPPEGHAFGERWAEALRVYSVSR